MKKIVLAIDSFKGSLTSEKAEQIVEEGLKSVFPNVHVVSIPIADGGEGLLDVVVKMTSGHKSSVLVHDPLMRERKADYGMTGDGNTAIVEMAAASGLPLLGEEERHPMLTTSFGTGELIRAAVEAGHRHVLLGIGGSATNDAGMGMLQALGVKFYDDKGHLLPVGSGACLEKVNRFSIDDMVHLMKDVEVMVACDVDNPFFGERGAAAVFAPQKGATPEEVVALDRGMRHFAAVIRRLLAVDVQQLAGSGAAGGMGGALAAFLKANLVPGADLILDKLDFQSNLTDADYVITGEGKADRQTLMGKVPAGVLKSGVKRGVPVVLMAGRVEDEALLCEAGFCDVVEVTPRSMPLEEAMSDEGARECLMQATVHWAMRQRVLDQML